MGDVMLASFLDELQKIAAVNTVAAGVASMGKPASVAQPMDIGKTISSATKAPTKPTNYSVVHNQSPMAATGTADSTKAVPPPPVRA